MQLKEQLKAVYAFPDLEETIVKMRNEADLLLENLQEETDLLSSVHNASIMGKREHAFQLSVSEQRLMKPIVHSIVIHPVLTAIVPEHFRT